MRFAPFQRIVQRRRRERLTHRRMPEPLRIRRTNVYHRMMHMSRTPRPELRHLHPPVFGEMRRHNFVGVFNLATRRESALTSASSPPDQAGECSTPQPISSAQARRAHPPPALLRQTMPESSQSADRTMTHRWKNARTANPQTTAASSSSRLRAPSPRPGTRLLVGHERHGRNFACPMATLAMILQDRQHIFVESRRGRRDRLLKSDAKTESDTAKNSGHLEPHTVILLARVFPS